MNLGNIYFLLHQPADPVVHDGTHSDVAFYVSMRANLFALYLLYY